MGGLTPFPSVRAADGQLVSIPGKSGIAGKGGLVLKVNPGGTAYELGTAGGAPVTGVAQALANAGTITDIGNAGVLSYSSVKYTISDPLAGGAFTQGPISDWMVSDGFERLHFKAGMYHPIVRFDIAWATVAQGPDWFTPLMFAGWDNPHQNQEIIAAVTSNYADAANPRRGMAVTLDYGPTFMENGASFGGGNYDYMRFECRWSSTATPQNATFKGLTATAPSLCWTIYKLG